jgi:hypothetical protein
VRTNTFKPYLATTSGHSYDLHELSCTAPGDMTQYLDRGGIYTERFGMRCGLASAQRIVQSIVNPIGNELSHVAPSHHLQMLSSICVKEVSL